MNEENAVTQEPQFEVKLASSDEERRAALSLRYDVFVRELGGDGVDVDHDAGLEFDRFDAHADHLLLLDHARRDAPVVGVYRLLRDDQRSGLGRFYSEDEFDLSPLLAGGRPLLELGRSCLHGDYRGGAAMFHMWQGLAQYVAEHGTEILFGVASFHGTDVEALAHPLSHLHFAHLAPEDLRPKAMVHQPMDILPETQVDRPRAVREIPALIKAYLRLGGVVGDGAFVDRNFNTVDVCLVMDTSQMSARHRDIYTKARAV